MFWNSIIVGLIAFFTNWQIWVSILLFCLITFAYFFVFMITGKDSEYHRSSATSAYTITGIILQGFTIAFLVALILPILCGGVEFSSISFLTSKFWYIILAGIFAIIAILGFSIIPFLGSIISNSAGVGIYIQGVIAFELLSNNIFVKAIGNSNLDVFPGFWVFTGFLIFSIILIYLFTNLLLVLLMKLGIFSEYGMGNLNMVFANFLGIFPALLCICIYGSYVYLSILDTISNSTI